jgi:glycine/D-amino acid oxidase-like deaminating enzyme
MARPWPDRDPTAEERGAYADAEPRSFWLDGLAAREPDPPLEGSAETDLCIVGGGFTGLWAALLAKADDPGRDVLLLEAETIGHGASGRNGGFASSSLTHGIANGLVRSKPVPFPPEPLRTAVIQLTRNRMAAADRNAGRRGAWLRTLDRLGLGFDS